MTKVCAVFASPNKNGLTAAVLDTFLKRTEGEQTDVFDVYEMSPAPCIGCGACKTFEGCINHDLDAFFSSFEESDLLVIASPVYCMSFPSPLKAIIDRFQRYYNARFSLGKRPAVEKSRKAVIILTAGSKREDGGIVVRLLERCFSVMNTHIASVVVLNDTDGHFYTENEINAAVSKAIEQIY